MQVSRAALAPLQGQGHDGTYRRKAAANDADSEETTRRLGGRVPLQTGRCGEMLQGDGLSLQGKSPAEAPSGREGGRGRVLRGERGNEGTGLTWAQTQNGGG